ncbi:DUF4040 domain-containing protein [Coprothermobacteraceae bacterium]|nr:DUF4040 domain-containing protein [Coprothermobacteraceae bacterium]
MFAFEVTLFISGLVAAIYAISSRNLLSAAIAAGYVSLVVSIFFLLLQAPDVAMAEAAVGAALSTMILVYAIKRSGKEVEL